MERGFGQELSGRFGGQFQGGQFPGGYGRGMGGGGHFFAGQIIGPIIALLVMALVVWAFWRLFHKAGFNGALGLLMLVPGVNVVAVIFLAFAEWPVHKELEQLRAWRLALASGTVPVPVAATPAEPVAETPPVEPSA